jgi:hypothetical protein
LAIEGIPNPGFSKALCSIYSLAGVQVACGKYHCLVRTAAGGVCTWGSARWGLMGTASTDELEHTGDSTEWFQPRPTRVVLEGGDTTVVQVAAAGNYSLALDGIGQVRAPTVAWLFLSATA